MKDVSVYDLDIEMLDEDQLIRIANFCDFEFGECGVYTHNDLDGILEIGYEFDWTTEEAIRTLFEMDTSNREEAFLYSPAGGIEFIELDDMRFMVKRMIEKNVCNGELKELIQECFNSVNVIFD